LNEVVVSHRTGTELVPAGLENTGKLVAVLLACFKIGDVLEDPGAFSGMMVRELAEYPPAVAHNAVRKAIRTIKWLPSIAEMIQICEELLEHHRQKARQAEWAEEWERQRPERERQKREVKWRWQAQKYRSLALERYKDLHGYVPCTGWEFEDREFLRIVDELIDSEAEIPKPEVVDDGIPF
jgi:hypothetical protein